MRDESPPWQKILAAGFSSSKELLDYLEIPSSDDVSQVEQLFPTRVPRNFAARMQKGNLNDPLLLQVLASTTELAASPGYVKDPLEEKTSNLQQGLIHKYHGRVLLTLTGVCAVNCRYCFRRHFPYQTNNPGRAGWDKVMTYIASNEHIHEVIFSGGDPLLTSDVLLSQLIQKLEKISHVQTIRFHSRVPIVLPERINQSLCEILQQTPLKKVVVFHANHPNELDESVAEAARRLRASGCHLLNQSVLLHQVNDDASILIALSHRLFACGILPYYLHLLDKVQGAEHFDIALDRSKSIFNQMLAALPGYLVPRLTREEPGAKSKTLISTMSSIY